MAGLEPPGYPPPSYPATSLHNTSLPAPATSHLTSQTGAAHPHPASSQHSSHPQHSAHPGYHARPGPPYQPPQSLSPIRDSGPGAGRGVLEPGELQETPTPTHIRNMFPFPQQQQQQLQQQQLQQQQLQQHGKQLPGLPTKPKQEDNRSLQSILGFSEPNKPADPVTTTSSSKMQVSRTVD